MMRNTSKLPIIKAGKDAYKIKRTMTYMIPIIIGGSIGILEPSIAFETTLSGVSIGIIGHSLIAENRGDIAKPQ